MEIAWGGNEDVMNHGEMLVRDIAKTLIEERNEELKDIGRDLKLVERYADNPYPRNAL